MARSNWRLALALAFWLATTLLSPAMAQDAPRIGVVTMEPGEIFFERFGHNAIVVDDPATGQQTSYNFGFFDMDEPNFFGDFISGEMRYWLVALPLEQDMARYRQLGRGASLQWLDLEDEQARALAESLRVRASGDEARYRYDYFTSNCSTQVRDALDQALGGTLKTQLTGRSQGNTYRSESVRLATPAAWMAIGFHLGLADYADRPLSRWEESFIPMRLRDALREVRLADGRPLVISEEILHAHRIGQPPSEAPRLRIPALVAGIVLALGVLWLGRRAPRVLAGAAIGFWTVAGLAGVTMLLIWFGSAHVAGHGNENLLLLSPLCLLLIPGGWARLRGREPSARFRWLLWIVVAGAALAGFLKFMPFRPQENVEWVLLLLPLHWALLRRLDPGR
ncbi:lipoprotein N-acyltransferase Lnb domain-containing protein [Arenimonas alkanexedens]